MIPAERVKRKFSDTAEEYQAAVAKLTEEDYEVIACREYWLGERHGYEVARDKAVKFIQGHATDDFLAGDTKSAVELRELAEAIKKELGEWQ